MEDPWIVEKVSSKGITLCNQQMTKRKIRHKDDVKPYMSKELPYQETPTTPYRLPTIDTFEIPPMSHETPELKPSVRVQDPTENTSNEAHDENNHHSEPESNSRSKRTRTRTL